MTCFDSLKDGGFAGWAKWLDNGPGYFDELKVSSAPWHTYENNLAYFQQECRHDAVEYRGDDYLCAAYTRSDDSDYVIVLPPVGNVSGFIRDAASICNYLQGVTKKRVVLRRVHGAVEEQLISSSCFRRKPHTEYENPRELPEDIYPQVIVDCSIAHELHGHSYMKIRNHIQKLRRTVNAECSQLEPDCKAELVQAIMTWAAEFNEKVRARQSEAEHKIVGSQGVDPDSYLVFCREFPEQVDNINYFGRVLRVDGKLVGFSFAGKTTENSAALYASLTMSSSRGSSEFLFADMIQTIHQSGTRFLNLGGAESEPLFRYKKKWEPFSLVNTYELEYTP